MNASLLSVVVLSATAAGGLAYVFLYPLLSGEARAQKRQKALIGAVPERRAERGSAASRRDQVAQSLKDIEAREKARNRVTLEMKLVQAGLTWTKSRYYTLSACGGLLLALLLFVLSGSPVMAVGGLFVGGLGVPRWVMNFRKKRRTNQFVLELPNAMDVIVRGIRSGLPLGDCMRIIASEAQEPLRSEFRAIVDAQTIGISVSESVAKLYERIPVPEANFFGIVIGIQQKSGGNLAETLSNLSRVVRERRKMAGKIKAMSTEATASAAIIACLPFIVAILTYLSSPSYIELLWTTQVGKIMLGVSAFWMATGCMVMKKMIAFDF